MTTLTTESPAQLDRSGDDCPDWCLQGHGPGERHVGEWAGPDWYATTGAQAIVRPEDTAGDARVRLALTGDDTAAAEIALTPAEGRKLYEVLVEATDLVEHPDTDDHDGPSWCVSDHEDPGEAHQGECVGGPNRYASTGAQAIVWPVLALTGAGYVLLAVAGDDKAAAELELN